MLIDKTCMEKRCVELKGFTKIYGKGKKSVTGCSNVDFTAGIGQITGLLGPNGAGKSTVLKALCGVHYGSEGTVSVLGSSDCSFIRSVTGFVPEFPQLDYSLTVKETLYFEADLHGVEKIRQKSLVEKAIDICQLDQVIYQKTGTLSKGFQQRTNLAKALCFDPEVLILDEFSGGLDPVQIISMKNAIKELSANKIVILSSHHIEEIQSLCSRIYIFSHGSVKACGSIADVVACSGRKNLEDAFLFFTQEYNK